MKTRPLGYDGDAATKELPTNFYSWISIGQEFLKLELKS